MRNFSDITEATGKIVFTFGRFNPPTTGHEKLITKVANISGSDPYRIYPSLTQNPKKDPLPHALKVAYMRKMFTKHSKNIIADKKAVTAIDIAVKLYDEGFKDLVMVVGSDRVKEFDSLLKRYNGVSGKRHGYYKFNTISVASAGERDPDAEGVTGMSASKMRAAAVEGDEKSFAMGVPKGFKDVSKLFQDVRKNMGIREDRDMGSMTDFESVRDAYLVGKVWNVGDLIEANGVTGIIIRKGTNYVSYNDGNGKVHKAWLHDITLDERNYAKEYANYQGTPEQIARRSSRNKARKIMGDKAVKGMDVGHKDNDPLNNDPKNLKMEDPSKNRREPRLREKSDLDEIPMALLKVKNAISQMTHPKGYEDMVKKYVRYMSEPKPYATKGIVIGDIVKQHKSVNPRGFQQYINKLVSKGKLPKNLAANFDIVSEVKQDPDIEDSKGTEPAKYYAKDSEGKGMSVSTKKARDTHFTKKKKGPAPGDADATTKPSTHTKKFKKMYGEAKAVAGSKVHKFIKGHNLPIDGKKYKEIEFETKGIDNSSKTVKLMVIHPKKIFGKEFNVPFKTLRMGPFTKLDIPNQMEVLSKGADQGDYIDDFAKSDAPQFKGKSKEKRKDMAIAAFKSKNESYQIDEALTMTVKGKGKEKYRLGYDQKFTMFNKGYTSIGITKQQVYVAKGPDGERVFSKKEFETLLKKGSIKMVDTGSIAQEQVQIGEESMIVENEGLKNKAEKSGISYSILKQVYNRGLAAYKTGHRPGTSAPQWAMARVNSFITKGSGTWGKADKDLADKVRGESVNPAQQAAIAISKKKKADGKSVNEWFEANTTRAKYQLQHGDNWWWKMNETHDAMLEKLGLCCDDCITEEELPCPPATKDVKINTKNRDATIKNHNYGPLNVDEPGDYFEKVAKYWKTTEEAAKKSLCGNCVAFDISPRMNECLPGETSDGDGVLGYCHMHHFKCHSARACHTWAKGGPIKSDEKSYDWQSRGQKESVQEADGPCWDGYKQVGMKNKSGRQVPNCVPEGNNIDEADDKLLDVLKKKLSDEGGAAGFKDLEDAADKMGVDLTPDMLKKMSGIKQHKDGDYILEKTKLAKFNQFESLNVWGEVTEEDKSGKKLNNPTSGDVKKYKVYVKNDKGNVVKVEFGDPNMSIKRDDPARRKAFRARHGCDTPGPKWKAKYWSCKFWSTKSVTDLMKG